MAGNARGDDGRPATSGLSARALIVMAVLVIAGGVAAYLARGTGGTDDAPASDPRSLRAPWIDPDGIAPIVGSTDVNPADGSIWIASNTGLWRLRRGADRPQQVTGSLDTPQGSGRISEQLVVRFQGANRLLASGHPPAASTLPPALGLIESDDAGRHWRSISQLGRGDYHALQLAGDAIVASVFGEAAVNVSRDGGKTFDTRLTPAALVDLAVDPDDGRRWVASTQNGLIASDDEGRTWRERESVPNIRFSWPAGDRLYRVDPGGPVKLSDDGGRTWEARGSTGGEPQALFADAPAHLYAVLIDGTVTESGDGGMTWKARVTPPS